MHWPKQLTVCMCTFDFYKQNKKLSSTSSQKDHIIDSLFMFSIYNTEMNDTSTKQTLLFSFNTDINEHRYKDTQTRSQSKTNYRLNFQSYLKSRTAIACPALQKQKLGNETTTATKVTKTCSLSLWKCLLLFLEVPFLFLLFSKGE